MFHLFAFILVVALVHSSKEKMPLLLFIYLSHPDTLASHFQCGDSL
jgi:hypothetical protein